MMNKMLIFLIIFRGLSHASQAVTQTALLCPALEVIRAGEADFIRPFP
jgi:hypothetical protein